MLNPWYTDLHDYDAEERKKECIMLKEKIVLGIIAFCVPLLAIDDLIVLLYE